MPPMHLPDPTLHASKAQKPGLLARQSAHWAEVWRNRRLLIDLSAREVRSRYRASALGLGWTIANPLLMLAVFSFVFGAVFGLRWPQAQAHPLAFALNLLCGMAVFALLFETVARAAEAISGNANYVKRVIFPLGILPLMQIGSALFHVGIQVALLLLAAAFVFGPSAAWLSLPLVWGAYVLGVAGVCWVVAAIGVYLRDVAQVIPVVLTALQFLSPVFYPISALPAAFRPWVQVLPTTWVIEQTRGIVTLGAWPAAGELALAWGIAGVLAALGLAFFHKLRAGFADVL